MELLIKLKLKYDEITYSLSEYVKRRNIKITLAILYWLFIAFLAYDFYKFGVATGNSSLLGLLVFIVLMKFIKKINKEQVDAE